jgi:anaerobic selenocysteine-containing dehydrogenase
MQEFITACPRNCYSTCTFRVHVENNRIKRILPYGKNLACPEGPCIKGLSYIERAHSGKRLLHPLRKNPDGSFSEITLESALDHISRKLAGIKRDYGPHGILWYRGSGNSGLLNETGYHFWKHFGGATTTYGNLCWPAGLEAVRVAMGSVKHNVPWDLVNAKAIIVWGKNPAETNIQEMAFIAKAKSSGSKIIVIDPRRTPTADKADVLFSPKPGTDAALALVIAKLIAENGLADNDFIKNHVTGYDAFISSLQITSDDAEKICGIPAPEIEKLATLIGNSKPLTIIAGYGIQRYTNGGQTIRALLSLAVITGNIGKPGAGFNYANLQSYVFDDPKEPVSYYPDSKKDAPFRRTISMAKLGDDILNADNPPVKSIWVERGNPILQAPGSAKVIEAFKKSEFNVVVEQFMTDTAQMADIILPAKDIFEQTDIIGSYWSPYVQLKPKLLEREGEIIPESEIYYHLGKKLGLNIPADLIPEPGNLNAENWLRRRISGVSSVTFEKLVEGPVIPDELQQIAYEDLIFETPSGKIELYSDYFRERWGVSPYPEYLPLNNNESQEEYPLIFMSPNRGSRIHSQFGNLDVIRKNADSPALEISVKDATDIGLHDGDKIRIFNKNGSIDTVARITDRLQKGVVVLHNGIWFDEGGGSNYLTMSLETDFGYGAAFHGQPVKVVKITEK